MNNQKSKTDTLAAAAPNGKNSYLGVFNSFITNLDVRSSPKKLLSTQTVRNAPNDPTPLISKSKMISDSAISLLKPKLFHNNMSPLPTNSLREFTIPKISDANVQLKVPNEFSSVSQLNKNFITPFEMHPKESQIILYNGKNGTTTLSNVNTSLLKTQLVNVNRIERDDSKASNKIIGSTSNYLPRVPPTTNPYPPNSQYKPSVNTNSKFFNSQVFQTISVNNVNKSDTMIRIKAADATSDLSLSNPPKILNNDQHSASAPQTVTLLNFKPTNQAMPPYKWSNATINAGNSTVNVAKHISNTSIIKTK